MRFNVAGHIFQIRGFGNCKPVQQRYEVPYGPFVHEGHGSGEDNLLFDLEIKGDAVAWGAVEKIYSNEKDVEPGYFMMTVYKNGDGYCFELANHSSDRINARLAVNGDFKSAQLSLHGSGMEQWLLFNTCVNLCYLLSTANQQTLLMHASCVRYKGKAYLFLGKSGTGKSTHSRMWLSALEGVELINDDHPIIRINEAGTVVVYGSPWSGKTNCYKNMEAPAGGIIRIVRAPYNRVRKLSPIQSYGSLITSCSGMTWEKSLADGRDRSIQGVIKSVPCWVMECLPNEDAAMVCAKTVVEEQLCRKR